MGIPFLLVINLCILTIGIGSFLYLLLCFVRVIKERWNITNLVAGMIAGECLCIFSTILFVVNALVTGGNDIGYIIAIPLRIIIFLSPAYFTGRLVRSLPIVHQQHEAAKRGMIVIAKMKKDFFKLKEALINENTLDNN